MNTNIEILLKNTYTLPQLKLRLRIIKAQLSKKFYGGNEVIDVSRQDSEWLKGLPENFLGTFNKDNLYQIMTELDGQINNLGILTIFLPFDPTDEGLEQIGIKVRNTFGSLVLLDIKYNPLLLAGCALSWKGTFRDYSLHSKINERKLAIIQSFKKFLR